MFSFVETGSVIEEIHSNPYHEVFQSVQASPSSLTAEHDPEGMDCCRVSGTETKSGGQYRGHLQTRAQAKPVMLTW